MSSQSLPLCRVQKVVVTPQFVPGRTMWRVSGDQAGPGTGKDESGHCARLIPGRNANVEIIKNTAIPLALAL